MRILALLPDSYGGFGGIAQYNRDLIDALCADARIESLTALTRHGAVIKTEYPTRYSEQTSAGHPLRYGITAWRMAAAMKPDLLLCGHLNLLPVASRIARRHRIPLCLELYGIEAWFAQTRVTTRDLASVTRAIAISRYTRTRFLAWSRMDPHRVSVLPNTIDLRRYSPGAAPADLRARYGLGTGPVLLTVGRLAPSERYKGHDRVLGALPAVLQMYPDCVYLIAGDGGDRPRLESLADSEGLEAHVRFIGRISDEELVAHYRLADVLVMPSSGEGFGFVFLEAAACGARVIGGNVDGSIDALREGRLGIAVDPADTRALEAALLAALAGNAPDGRREVASFETSNYRRHVARLLLLPNEGTTIE